MKKNYDLIYLGIMIGVLLLDLLTRSDAIEALAFVLIVIGFVFSVLPNKKNIKDERVRYLKMSSGYFAFMMTTIVICILLFANRYFGFSRDLAGLLRYLMMTMYVLYSIAYAITKRKG